MSRWPSNEYKYSLEGHISQIKGAGGFSSGSSLFMGKVKTLEPVEESVAHSAPKTLSKGSCR